MEHTNYKAKTSNWTLNLSAFYWLRFLCDKTYQAWKITLINTSFLYRAFLSDLFIVLFVLLVQFLWRYIDELVGKGLDTKTIAELMLYISASLVPMALPLSILMASLMTFGNLGERYELTAIKASGISLQRIMRPLVLVVLILSIGDFFLQTMCSPMPTCKCDRSCTISGNNAPNCK